MQIKINLQKGITFNKISVSSFAVFEQMKDRPYSSTNDKKKGDTDQ